MESLEACDNKIKIRGIRKGNVQFLGFYEREDEQVSVKL